MVDTVKRFLVEADSWGLEVEVVLFDDCSRTFYQEKNASLATLDPRVRYLPLIENVGRSRIRNRMADYATGNWLLFLDCDMMPIYPNFLARYFEAMQSQADVVCGGVVYEPKPTDRQFHLQWRVEKRQHWHRQRFRKQSEALALETGNFMIRTELYQRVRFDESLSGYGQENRLFALALDALEVPLKWIDNPTRHLGRENNVEFLQKIEESTVNLVRVWHANPTYRPMMMKTSRQLWAVTWLRRLRLLPLLGLFFRWRRLSLRKRIARGPRFLWPLRVYQFCYLADALRRPNLLSTRSWYSRIDLNRLGATHAPA